MSEKTKTNLLIIIFTIASILFLTLAIYTLVTPPSKEDILHYRESIQVSPENLKIYELLKENESVLLENGLSSELLINAKANIIDNEYEYIFVNPEEQGKKVRVIANLETKEVAIYEE